MSAEMCEPDRLDQMARDLAAQRREMEKTRRETLALKAELDELKARLRRGLGQVLADTDRNGSR
jgi:cell division protein FtsB